MIENPYQPPESDLELKTKPANQRRRIPPVVTVGRICNFIWLASCAWLLPKMPGLLADPLYLLISAAAITALVFGIVSQRSKLRQRIQAVTFILYAIRAFQSAVTHVPIKYLAFPKPWLASAVLGVLLLCAAWRILFGQPARDYFR